MEATFYISYISLGRSSLTRLSPSPENSFLATLDMSLGKSRLYQ